MKNDKKMREAQEEKVCIHCKKPEIGRCPVCNRYSCIKQNCLEMHYAICKKSKPK